MMDPKDRAEIVRLTEEYGGQWGINHTRRLLQLIEIIGQSLQYDHALRSKQVAESFLREQDFPPELIEAVLECIEQHHPGGANRRIESILLSDADALDFLGAVGVLRDFSKKPNDLRAPAWKNCQK